jgi:hypothetical protein
MIRRTASALARFNAAGLTRRERAVKNPRWRCVTSDKAPLSGAECGSNFSSIKQRPMPDTAITSGPLHLWQPRGVAPLLVRQFLS